MPKPAPELTNSRIVPDDSNGVSMWDLLEELHPLYRALCGPGFLDSLERIQKRLPLEINEYPTGTDVFGWTIPEEFSVNEAWVEHESGVRVIDFNDHPYHVSIYSQPIDIVVDKAELLEHVETHTHLPDAVPLRQVYYRKEWALCASQNQVKNFPEGKYKVHIDTKHEPGFLRIGDFYLPGETDQEILINTYLCHPMGANDNLSSVVIAVELFKLLQQRPNRRFSYRLCLWPESIGAITYIAQNPERLKKLVGGYSLMMCGDKHPVSYTGSFRGGSIFDRAAKHALKHGGWPDEPLPYSRWTGGSDSGHFDSAGQRIPFGTWTRGGPVLDKYPQYHSSEDDLSQLSETQLLETMTCIWDALLVVEKAQVYKIDCPVDPFLSKHDIFPFQHGAGGGKHGNLIARAYFELMGAADGTLDLLAIADKFDMDISLFDEPVEKFIEAGLMSTKDV
jgi:aminopeptidase-like protein